MNYLRSTYRFFTSFALATIVLVLLTLITLLGTLAQVDLGLWGAVQKYFHSWFVTTDLLGPIPIPLPGGLLLMLLLFVNMTLGAVVHVRKRTRGIPNLVSHLGILFLLVSAFVTFVAKNDGFVALFPGQASNMARSYKTWQLEVLEFNEAGRPTKAHVIPWEELTKLNGGDEQEFTFKALPFSVKVDTFLRNANPIPASAPMAVRAGDREINGFKLLSAKKEKEEERNFPALFATVLKGENREEVAEMIISSYSASHMAGESPRVAGFKIDDKQYGLLLTKTTWPIDYYIKLDRFIFEKHPGTDQPKNYESRITRMDTFDDEGKKVAIRMNEPMRHGGFVVFQESFGQNPDTGEYYSQFAVSDNPSDQWPTIALTIMGIGMFLHFIWKLVEYINKSKAERLKKAKD